MGPCALERERLRTVPRGAPKHGRARTAGLKNPANEPAIELATGERVEAALIGKETPAEAMQAAQKQVNPLLLK